MHSKRIGTIMRMRVSQVGDNLEPFLSALISIIYFIVIRYSILLG